MKKLFLSIVFTGIAIHAMAQESGSSGTLVTDRPNQTESSLTMPKGYFQIETGFLLTEFKVDVISGGGVMEWKLQSLIYNTSLFRYGVTDNIELRLIQEVGRSRTRADGSTINKSDVELVPTMIGAKVHLAHENGALPQMAFLAHVGGSPLSDVETGVLGDFRFIMEHSLSQNLSLAYNLGGRFIDDFDEFISLYTLSLGYALNPELSAFAEIYGFFPSFGEPDHQVDFGLIYVVSPNLQLDIFGGTGLSQESPDTIFGFGLSVRIPGK